MIHPAFTTDLMLHARDGEAAARGHACVGVIMAGIPRREAFLTDAIAAMDDDGLPRREIQLQGDVAVLSAKLHGAISGHLHLPVLIPDALCGGSGQTWACAVQAVGVMILRGLQITDSEVGHPHISQRPG